MSFHRGWADFRPVACRAAPFSPYCVCYLRDAGLVRDGPGRRENAVGGSSAPASDYLETKGSASEIRLTVTDEAGNATSDAKSIREDLHCWTGWCAVPRAETVFNPSRASNARARYSVDEATEGSSRATQAARGVRLRCLTERSEVRLVGPQVMVRSPRLKRESAPANCLQNWTGGWLASRRDIVAAPLVVRV